MCCTGLYIINNLGWLVINEYDKYGFSEKIKLIIWTEHITSYKFHWYYRVNTDVGPNIDSDNTECIESYKMNQERNFNCDSFVPSLSPKSLACKRHRNEPWHSTLATRMIRLNCWVNSASGILKVFDSSVISKCLILRLK